MNATPVTRSGEKIFVTITHIFDECQRFAHPHDARGIQGWGVEMVADAPCLVDECLPARGKAISPACKGGRFRDDFSFFDGCDYAAERCDGGHYPYIQQEEAGFL